MVDVRVLAKLLDRRRKAETVLVSACAEETEAQRRSFSADEVEICGDALAAPLSPRQGHLGSERTAGVARHAYVSVGVVSGRHFLLCVLS